MAKKDSKVNKVKKTSKKQGKASSKKQDPPAQNVSKNKPKAAKSPKKQDQARKPPRSDQAGLNLAVARARNVLDTGDLNHDVLSALKEIKEAIQNDKSPNDLSAEAVQAVEAATQHARDSQMSSYARGVVSEMSKEDRDAYMSARKKAKAAFDHAARAEFTDDDQTFDVHQFNREYNKNFYDDFEMKEPDGEKTPLQVQAELVSKGKIRLGAQVKVIFTAFLECLVRQMAVNGTFCCVSGKKMIVNVKHAIDFSKEGTETRFPLYHFVRNLKTYKTAVERAAVEGDAEAVDEEASKGQFRLYVGEAFKAARQDMSKAKFDLGTAVTKEVRSKFSNSSVSKELRTFCSDVVVEVLNMISTMLRSELEDKKVKTVTNPMLRTVIQHIHTVSGVDYEPTRKFIQEVSAQYVKHIAERREEKQRDKKEEKPKKSRKAKKNASVVQYED